MTHCLSVKSFFTQLSTIPVVVQQRTAVLQSVDLVVAAAGVEVDVGSSVKQSKRSVNLSDSVSNLTCIIVLKTTLSFVRKTIKTLHRWVDFLIARLKYKTSFELISFTKYFEVKM